MREIPTTSHRTVDDTLPSLLSLNMLQTSYAHDTTATTMADPSQLRMSMLDASCKPQGRESRCSIRKESSKQGEMSTTLIFIIKTFSKIAC